MMRDRISARNGFVLATALLLLLVLTGLGAGAFFLTNVNLRIAENTRSAALARYNADVGLDLALIVLANRWTSSDGEWPDDLIGTGGGIVLDGLLPREFDVGSETTQFDFAVTQLELSEDGGFVAVRGRGGRGGEYTASARFVGAVTSEPLTSTQTDVTGVGFVTPLDILGVGGPKFYLNVWSGGRIIANGPGDIGSDVRVRNAFRTCVVGSGRFQKVCEPNAGVPTVSEYTYASGYALLSGQRPGSCDRTISGPDTATLLDVTSMAGETICVTDGASLTVTGTASGLFILGDEDATVRIEASTAPAGTTPDGVGMKVAAGTVELPQGGSMGLGTNTIFARNSIFLGRDVLEGEDGVVRTYVATEGDIRFNGAGNQLLYGTFRANGVACFNGTLGAFYGSIITAGSPTSGEDPTACPDNRAGIDFRGNGGLAGFYEPRSAIVEDFDDDRSVEEFSVSGLRLVSRE